MLVCTLVEQFRYVTGIKQTSFVHTLAESYDGYDDTEKLVTYISSKAVVFPYLDLASLTRIQGQAANVTCNNFITFQGSGFG